MDATALQVLQLSNIRLTGLERVERPTFAEPLTRELRSVDLASMFVGAQTLIVLTLPLPSASLLISDDPNDPDVAWTTILHPEVASRLRPITFSTLYCHYRYMELRAGPTTNRGRFDLRVSGVFFPVLLMQKTAMFDLSSVQTLELHEVSRTYLEAWGLDVFVRVKGITKIVLHKSWCSAALIANFPDLRELHIVATDLRAFATSSRFVVELVSGLRRRRVPQRDGTVFPPLERVVLEKCRGLEDNIGLLRGEIEVTVVE